MFINIKLFFFFLRCPLPLGDKDCSGKKTMLWERVTIDLMNTKETFLPQEVNVWSLSVT